MTCPFCGDSRVEKQEVFDYWCLNDMTVSCSCVGCGLEWFDDTTQKGITMNKYEEFIKKVEESATDAIKFYDKGNKAAGVRLRKFMQEIKTLAQECRNEVTAISNK